MPNRSSYFFRKLVLTVLAVALPLIGLLAMTLSTQAKKDQALLKASLREKAVVASRLAENTLSQLNFVLAFMGTSTGLSVTDPLFCHKLMRDVPRLHALVIDIALFDLDGRTICQSISQPGQEAQYVDQPWFQEALKKDRPFITKPFIGLHSKRSLVALSHPVFDSTGKRMGMLGAALSTEVLAERLLPEIDLPLSNFGIIRSDGTLIAVRGDVTNWLGRQMRTSVYQAFIAARDEPMSFTGQLDGVERFGISSAIPDFDLHVVLSVPRSAVLGPARTRAYESAVIAAGITLAVLAAAWVGAKRLDRPISSLAGTARAFAEGQPDAAADETLPGEFKVLAKELNKAIAAVREAEEATRGRAAAEAASLAKSAFLANMSHEIRTPMNAILGMTDLALREPLGAKPRDYLLKVQKAARNLLGIINDILDFSKIEAKKLELENVDFLLIDVLDRVRAVVGLQAKSNEQDFLFDIAADIPPRLTGDPLRLEQVLTNLCCNAVKFAGHGQLVRVSARLVQRELIRFAVRDSGPGMSRDQAAQLFQPFNQLDASTTRRHGGTGLGLAICRQLVELMGGEIGVQSEPGRGAEFFFTLPLSKGALQVTDQDWQHLIGRRVLVVDDCAAARELISGLLTEMGVDVLLADSADSAIALVHLQSAPLDAVLIDRSLPELDGFQLAGRLQDLQGAGRNFVIVTAYDDNESSRRALELGLADCVFKPFGRLELAQALTRSLDRQGVSGPPSEIADLTVTPAQLRGIRVLLVEDTEFNQIVASDLLGGVCGMQVTIASDGSQALNELSDNEFDVILMDVQMPGMDGYEVTRRIRQKTQLSRVPIIAMTAYAMASDQKRCIEAGMNDFITKPFEPAELFAVITRWVERRQTESLALPNGSDNNSHQEAPVDFVDGLHRCLGREELHVKIISRFIENDAEHLTEVQRALTARDWNALVLMAHKSTSSAGTLGARQLSKLARQLETTALEAQGVETIEAAAESYAAEHERVMAELRHYLLQRSAAIL